MRLREALVKKEELRRLVDTWMQEVKPDCKPDHVVYEIELLHADIVRGFLSALLIDNPAQESGIVWLLLENRVPSALLNDPAVLKEKEYFSAPLKGTPTEVLTRLHILNHKGPWHKVSQAVRDSLDPDQRQVMFLLEGLL